jgi:hypothetical protein
MKRKRREKILTLFVQVTTKEDKKRKQIFLILYPKKFEYSLEGYSYRKRWSCTQLSTLQARRQNYRTRIGVNYRLHCQQINIGHWYSLIHSHPEGFSTSRRKQPEDFGYWNSQTRLTTKLWFSSCVVAINSLNAMVVKDHEGKTSGSVLYGLVYAHECTLLVNFRIHNAKKNPSGCTGYLEKYWNLVFGSPKCGKRLDYARYRVQVRGLSSK